MTLLEALLATVILAVVAVACLEGTHGAATLQHRTASMSRALSRAEAAMETAATHSTAAEPGASDANVDVQRDQYHTGAGRGVQRIAVSVRDADGRVVRLTRLVEAPSAHAQAIGARP